MQLNKQKLQALQFCFIASLISTIGFLSPQIATILSIFFSVLLILWSNPMGLPALSILWIQAIDFFPGTEGSDLEIPGAVYLVGFPLTLPLITLCCITVRVLFEGLVHFRTFSRLRWITIGFVLWLGLFLITLVSAYLGKNLGNSNWTQPLRISMSLASMFYGIILAKKLENKLWVLNWMLRIAAFVLLLMLLNVYWSHIGFFYVAVGSCSLLHLIRQKRWLLSLLCATPLLFIFLTGDTLTMFALTLVSLAIGYLLMNFNKSVPQKLFSIGTLAILPLGFLMISVVLILPFALPVNLMNQDTDLATRFLFKLYLDRGPLWDAAWQLAKLNYNIVTPSGSSLILENSIHSLNSVWNVHVHNTFLEMLRQTGFLGAAFFIVVFPLFWFRLRKALLQPLPIEVRVFGGAALVASAVGAITGIFPFDFAAGPWIWLWSGVAISMSQNIMQRNCGKIS